MSIRNNSASKNNFICSILILAMMLLPAFAQVYAAKTWNGSAGTNWNTGSNWNGGNVPVSNEDANIPGGLANYPLINNSVSIKGITINNTGSGASVTLTTGGTLTSTGLITVNSAGTLSILNGTAALAGISSSGTLNISGGTVTSTVDITISSGTFTQSGGLIWMAANTSSNPTDDLVITGGTVTQSGGTIYTRNYGPAAATYNQTGSGALLKVYNEWKPTSSNTFNSTAGTVQFTSSAGSSNFSSTNSQFNNIVVDALVNPGFSIASGSLVKISGNFTNNNTALNVGNDVTFTFNGPANQTISGTSTGYTFGHLVVNKSGGTLSLANAVNIKGNFTMTAGTFDPGTYLLDIFGTFISFTGGTIKVGAATFAGNYNKTLSPAAGTSVEYSAAGTQTISNSYNYADLSISGSGAKTLPSSAMSVYGNFTTSGTVSVNAAAAITTTGNFTIGSGTEFIAGAYSHSIGGNFADNGTFTATGSTIIMNGASAQTIGGSVAATFANLKIDNTAGVTLLKDNTINNSLNLTNGQFSLNGKNLNVADSAVIYRSGGSVSATPGFIGVVDIVYNQNTSVIETGAELPGNVNTIRDITINNTNGVQLFKDITINRTLDFDVGKIDILVYDIKLAPNAAITGYDATKYIIAGSSDYLSGAGRLSRFINNTTATADQVFPLGTATSFTPCYISTLNTTGTNYNINLFGKVMDKGTNGIVIDYQVINRTWDIVPDNEPNAIPTTLKLQWNPGDEAANFEGSSVTISKNRHIAGVDENWAEPTGTITRQIDTPPYWVSVDGISSFSNFAGGSKAGGIGWSWSPLPINLLSFSASCDGDKNILNWTTATETNNDYFTIEKSINTSDWISVGIVDGAGNSNEQISYSFTDDVIDNSFYYRLKQTDFNGQYSYSAITYSEPCNHDEASITSIYPNPFSQNVTISFISPTEGELTVNVVNLYGEIVYAKTIEVISGGNIVELNLSDINKGPYLFYFSNSPGETYSIVKQ